MLHLSPPPRRAVPRGELVTEALSRAGPAAKTAPRARRGLAAELAAGSPAYARASQRLAAQRRSPAGASRECARRPRAVTMQVRDARKSGRPLGAAGRSLVAPSQLPVAAPGASPQDTLLPAAEPASRPSSCDSDAGLETVWRQQVRADMKSLSKESMASPPAPAARRKLGSRPRPPLRTEASGPPPAWTGHARRGGVAAFCLAVSPAADMHGDLASSARAGGASWAEAARRRD
ncbi:unnamed protein product [Prorocentrum cordatum]|uniref:Uncharacterized protein n=1 Tax=Prorocentrum cordatum TaxID=2364126 RepID=A0ABN9TQM2_9DINO|nr:unnamed protein product [Polarella glacialis]